MWYTAKDSPAASQGMYGLIAEEVAAVDPTLVYSVPDEEQPGAERPESVHYQQLGLLLVTTAQEHGGQIEELKARAEAAEAWVATLEAEMRELRAMVAALAATAR